MASLVDAPAIQTEEPARKGPATPPSKSQKKREQRRRAALEILHQAKEESGIARRPLLRNTLIAALAIAPLPAILVFRVPDSVFVVYSPKCFVTSPGAFTPPRFVLMCFAISVKSV